MPRAPRRSSPVPRTWVTDGQSRDRTAPRWGLGARSTIFPRRTCAVLGVT
ncbi:predicted protein [Streptomyces lividans TK24]|uniref:Uncharacterized protein n=1 Tax=Streptomyces lividans 1326 TaxID=1200984 RepID=A0A7U9DXK0_STRLI|nr:predicted protein [Streptomyces lividans TK24]EOY49491.1 hypothetical protein SLI_4783 [Streptomyces lividans 1326]